MDSFWRAPPVTRTITAAVVIFSCAAYANISFLRLCYFDYYSTFKIFPPQVWRLATAFLISGPKLYIIMDPYFLFTYGRVLETGSPRFQRKGDFAWYILVLSLVISMVAGVVLGAPFFNEALMLAFVHTVAQDSPRMKTHLVIFEIEARFLPYGLLFLNFVTRGPQSAMTGAAGILAAHFFDFMTRIWPTFGGGRNWLAPPSSWTRLFGGQSARVENKSYGQAHYRTNGHDSGSSSGRSAASSSAGSSWRSRGAGRRLGE